MDQSCGGTSTNFALRSRLCLKSLGLRERHMKHATDGAALDAIWLPAHGRGAAAPTAVLLHGRRGLFGDGDALLPARSLVAWGLNVLLVRGLRHPAIDLDGRLPGECLLQSAAQVGGLLDRFAELGAGAPPPALGIVGISACGPAALELAGMDTRVRAAVSCFAPLCLGMSSAAANTPAALILHGQADAAVPVERAAELEALLRKRGSDSTPPSTT